MIRLRPQPAKVPDRRTTAPAKLPRVTRCTIDGGHRGKWFRTHAEAERYVLRADEMTKPDLSSHEYS